MRSLQFVGPPARAPAPDDTLDSATLSKVNDDDDGDDKGSGACFRRSRGIPPVQYSYRYRYYVVARLLLL